MSAHRRSLTGVFALIAVAVGIVAIPLLNSSPAQAHHSVISASVDCSGTISFQAGAWDPVAEGWPDDPLSRTNSSVLVWISVNGATVDSRSGAFAAENGFGFGGTFSWPGGASQVQVSAQEQANWGNGYGPSFPAVTVLNAPDNCGINPQVASEAVCANGDGMVTVTFSNNAGEFGGAVEFLVSSPVSDSVAVASGSVEQRTYGPFPDGTQTVVISVNGTDVSQTHTIDCDQAEPSASFSKECVNNNGRVVVTVANTGTEGITFAVTFNGQASNVEVGPGGSETLVYEGLADGDYPLNVTAGGQTLISENVSIDCKQPDPKASVTLECVDGNGTVVFTLSNAGAEGTTFNIAFGSEVREIPVAPGSTETVVFPGLADGNYPAVVTAFGKTLVNKSLTVQCDRPGTPKAEVTTDCADLDGVATIVVRNVGGELPLTFLVNDQRVVVPANGSDSITITGLLDGPYTITIRVEGSDAKFDQVITTKCDRQSTVSFEPVCNNGDGIVNIALNNNNDDRPVVFTINGQDRTVDAGATVVVPVGPYPDGPATITYQIDGEPAVPATYAFTVACDRPGKGSVGLEVECAQGEATVVVTLANLEGDLPVTFVVNGTEYRVAPGTSKQVDIGNVPDGPYTPTISADGEPVDVTIEVDCDLPVLGATAVCTQLQASGTTSLYWFEVTNTEAVPVEIAWNGGTTVLDAGATTTISSTSDPLRITYTGTAPDATPEVVLEAPASGEACENEVVVVKEVNGPAPSGSTFTVKVSKLEGDVFFEELTVDVHAGVPMVIMLPSSLDGTPVEYTIDEIEDGGAHLVTVTPPSFSLEGHLGETVSVKITNAFAAVEIVKTVDAEQSEIGADVTYTLVAENTGGLPLRNVVITDRLPTEITYVSATVAGGAGTCSLADSAPPQLVRCDMDGVLDVGEFTSPITVVARVNTGLAPDTLVQNRAKVLGQFFDPASPTVPPNVTANAPTDMSCLPAVEGTVCDLSAAVNFVVKVPVVLPPTTTTTTTPPTTVTPTTVGTTVPGTNSTTTTTIVASAGPTVPPRGVFPTTGSNNTKGLLAVALASVAAGATLVLVRRRPAR
jgi:uncharacterized repeat protein (TIGR01451 family)